MSEMTDNYLTNIAQLRILGEEEQYDFYKNDGIFSGLVNLFNNSEEVRENTNASIKYIRKQANTLHLTLSNNMKYEVYIKKHFYKTKGVANGNGYKYQYASEFIYGYKGHNYVCRVKKNIFSMYHERGSVYTIRVNKDNPYNGVMGNEQTIYMILSIVWFALVGFYIMLLALERLM